MKNLKKGFIILFLAMIAFSNLPATEVSAATNKVTATKSTKKKKIPSVKKGTNIVSVKASSSWKDSKAVKFTAPKYGVYTFALDGLKSDEEGMTAYFAFFADPKRKKILKVQSISAGKDVKMDFGRIANDQDTCAIFNMDKGQTIYFGVSKTNAISSMIEEKEFDSTLRNGETVKKVKHFKKKIKEDKSFDFSYRLKIKYSKDWSLK